MTEERQSRRLGGTGWNISRSIVGVAPAAINLFFTLPTCIGPVGAVPDALPLDLLRHCEIVAAGLEREP